MKLSPDEIASVRNLGLYVTEKCDGCPKVLNQSWQWTIKGRPEVYCCEEERDRAFEFLKRRGALKEEPVMPRRAHRRAVAQSGTGTATAIRFEGAVQPGATGREIRGGA